MESQFEKVPQQGVICDIHNRSIHKICTQDQQFLCILCEQDHREHVVKSLAFVAEEISEQLRVKLVPNEKMLDSFQTLIKEIDAKFKRSNLKTVLNQIVEVIKLIVKGLDKSQVIDDSVILLESFRMKIDKMNQMKKKVKLGDRQCMEVLKAKKEIDEAVQNISRERQLLEVTMEELRKINQNDFNLVLGDQQYQDSLKQRLTYSMIELVREKSEAMASLLIPQGMEKFIQDQAKMILQQQQQPVNLKSSDSYNFGLQTPQKSLSNFGGDQSLSSIQQSSNNLFSTQMNTSFTLTQEKLELAHQDFINSICDIGPEFYATAGSDYKLNIWSKQTFTLLESFQLPGEVVSMTKAANEQLVCGMINGTIGIIDCAKMQVSRILERAHTGTVISCLALRKGGRELIVTQDDSREIKVWNINDFSMPIIRTIGRSYNPVWYIQSLIEIMGEESKEIQILSSCGSEPKIIQYKIDPIRKELSAVQSSYTKAIPTAIVQINSLYYAAASSSEIEIFDIVSGMNVSTIQTQKQESLSQAFSSETLLTLAVFPVPNDQNKRYIATGGTDRILYIYKIDTLLKCSSIPVYQLETSHQNTISGLIYFSTSDQLYFYLVTVSIDKHQSVFRISMPEFNSQKQIKGQQQHKSLMKMDSQNKMNVKNASGTPVSGGVSGEENFKFLNDYLKDNQNIMRGGKNSSSSCGCQIY